MKKILTMGKRIISVLLLVLILLTLCSCESDLEKAQRKADEAAQRYTEAQRKADEAKEKVRILEHYLGDD